MSKMTGAQRKAQILEAGAKLASKNGAANVTRRMVAEQCKCAEGLVSVYMGDSATAQKAYARKAKSLGLALPDKAKSDAIGVKMRSHGPRDKRDTRKRSAKEVEAIKRKQGPGYSVKTRTTKDGTTVVNVKATRKDVDLRKVALPQPQSLFSKRALVNMRKVKPIGKAKVNKDGSVDVTLNTKGRALLRETKPKPARESKPLASPKRALPSPGEAPTPPERKSAARKPKAYPANDGPPQPMPSNLVGSLP